MFICPSLASYFISNCVLSLNMSCLSLCTEVLRSVLLLVTVLTNTFSCYAYLHLIMQRATPLFTDLCCSCCWLKELQLFLEQLVFFLQHLLWWPWLADHEQTAFSLFTHMFLIYSCIHVCLFPKKWICLTIWFYSSWHEIKMDPVYFLNARSWCYSARFISR